jgi:predicted enzyme related to lactoylglutathione lyase
MSSRTSPWPSGMPCWAELTVPDVAVTANGGTVLMTPIDTSYGRMAAAKDPAGAAFWMARTDGSGQPDRGD